MGYDSGKAQMAYFLTMSALKKCSTSPECSQLQKSRTLFDETFS